MRNESVTLGVAPFYNHPEDAVCENIRFGKGLTAALCVGAEAGAGVKLPAWL
jgi:hypothetical protein